MSADGPPPSTSASSTPAPTYNGMQTRRRGLKTEPNGEEEETMEVDEAASPDESQAKRRSGQKRKLDAIDLESSKLNMNLRSRFSSNEYDMVSLINFKEGKTI
jgi:hypothetical protein